MNSAIAPSPTPRSPPSKPSSPTPCAASPSTRRNVIGHSDIAPARKEDPGELFPWDRLAAKGLAAPVPTGGFDPNWNDEGTLRALHRYGYDVTDPQAAVIAFQRRFRQANIDGVIDAETRTILRGLLVTP